MNLLRDQKVVEGLKELIDNYANKDKPLPEQRTVNKVKRSKKRTGREMQLTVQIGDFEMDQVILNLGSHANVFPKQTWERMGKLKLQWSPIQLRMVNQQKVIPMRRLHGVTVDIEGGRAVIDSEVIEIVDDSNPYLVLLGIVWAFDMNEIINLKKRSMVFEKNGLHVIISLDPIEGARYTKPNHDYYEDEDIEHIYKLTV